MESDEESDDALVARAGRGDRAAASLLIARHTPVVLGLCRRMLRDGALAEDAAQETFLKLWRFAPKWRAHGALLGSWLTRVAANACVDRLRVSAREAPAEAAGDPVDEAPGAFESLSADDRRAAVEAALAALPDRQRMAVVLCHYQELTNAEAAAALKVSIDALESLLARARRSLRASLLERREELMEGA
ncbi:MAG TPA: RNA polymerase sigma factor [Parvularculaceae bacterium]|nr:RNA polymerase sigma factor [Parvularculaceae bacterium]